MDHFGIGAAMQGAARIYMQSARRSGRTTSLVESVKDGDRIYFHSQKEADRVKRLCAERGVEVECLYIPPAHPQRVYDYGSLVDQRRAIFDHTWVEQYYLDAIERAGAEIDRMERETSGWGEVHRETRRKAIEIFKWRI